MKFGLTEKQQDLINNATMEIPEIEEVVIFGSRAMGNYKKGSDVDIALFGKAVNRSIASKLSFVLNEELYLPYYFDVIAFNTINNEALREHIITFGEVFYHRRMTC